MHVRSGATGVPPTEVAGSQPRPVGVVDVAALPDAHDGWLRGYVRALRPAGELDDVMQTIWLKVVRAAPQLRDAEALEPWLKAIARNTVSSMSSQQRRLPVPTTRVPDVGTSVDGPEDACIEREDRIRALRALATLPEAQRRLIWRRHVLEEQPRVIAASTGHTEGTVRVALTRSRRDLRTAFDRLSAVAVALALRVSRRSQVADQLDRLRLEYVLVAAVALVVGSSPQPFAGSPATPEEPPVSSAVRLDDRGSVSPLAGDTTHGGRDGQDDALDAPPRSQPSTRPAPDVDPTPPDVIVGLPTGGGVTHQDEPDPDPDLTVGTPALGTVDIYVQRYLDDAGTPAGVPVAPG